MSTSEAGSAIWELDAGDGVEEHKFDVLVDKFEMDRIEDGFEEDEFDIIP